MNTGGGSEDLSGVEGEHSSRSSTASMDQTCARRFLMSGEKLVSTLQWLQSYQIILQADVNHARLYQVPLASDLKTQGLKALFSRHKPKVLELEQVDGAAIHWADVVRSPTYCPELQDDGHYHVRVDKGNALVELSKADHDFIVTGIPQRLIDPHSYLCDVVSEIDTVRLAMAQIAPLKDITVQCS